MSLEAIANAVTGSLIVACLALATLVAPSKAAADEYDRFAVAKNAFDAGEYPEAVKRFEALLKAGLQNPSLIIEAHKLLAISYLFNGNKDLAESHFTKLLTRAPDFTLDPLLYPIEVVDFFTEVKQKSKKQLEALAKARAIEAAKRKEEEAARQKAEAERLTRNVYVEREVTKGSLLVAALPFGAGQFQNGEPVKGALFLSSELLLLASATVFYFLHAGLREQTVFDDPNETRQAEHRQKIYRIGNWVSVGTLAVVGIAGILDGILRFQKETISWKPVPEKEVPDEVRPKKQRTLAVDVNLTADPHQFGISIGGRF